MAVVVIGRWGARYGNTQSQMNSQKKNAAPGVQFLTKLGLVPKESRRSGRTGWESGLGEKHPWEGKSAANHTRGDFTSRHFGCACISRSRVAC